MRVLLPVLLPACAAGIAFLLPSNAVRRGLLLLSAVAHLVCVGLLWSAGGGSGPGEWLALDAPGLVVLAITSVLFLVSAFYAIGYLRREGAGPRRDFEEGRLFADAPERVFVGCLLFFLAAMSLVTVSHHLGLLWVAIEATTLASAPLIYFHRHHRSLEATWKYLLLCSVGIALALLGTFFLAVAASAPGSAQVPLVLSNLVAAAPSLNHLWLRAALIFMLVGYGTKMGLAPLHAWLPDAHSESPSLVSALMSGALLNCAFLGILRGYQISVAAGDGAFMMRLLLVLGLLSMTLAAGLILGQADYKRMLAYSSVEHMGILALAVGIGGAGRYGAMLHAVNHSLAKACLFLVSGNVLAAYRTKSAREVSGLLRALPWSGPLWVGGFLAITGSPPFGPFLSELVILKAALDGGHPVVAALYLALLTIIFIGMSAIVLRMAQPGEAGVGLLAAAPAREAPSAFLPPLALAAAMLLMGLYVPPALQALLLRAGRALGSAP
ncbi:MAG TPA: proton-conducting transporter membrane subunit [Candidatus Polarisedimenticolia bacterium]|nr:proton-conducting transporter membrane subunit [Candidatus Polarisedimenticolia bacterium]